MIYARRVLTGTGVTISQVNLNRAEKKAYTRTTAIIRAYDDLLSALEEEYYVGQGRTDEPREMRDARKKRDWWVKARQRFLERIVWKRWRP